MDRIRIILTLLFTFYAVTAAFAAEIKEADLAGSWYPSSGAQLESLIDSYLDAAKPEKINGKVFAIIAPHAGYLYSGPVAAYGYKAVEDKGIKTVIILGFSHRKYFDGVSVYGGNAWKTPLGEIAVDTAMAQMIISSSPRFGFQKELFSGENSVEMQIPFIQVALNQTSLRATEGSEAISKSGIASAALRPRNDGVKIVPIAFGNQNYDDARLLAAVLANLIKERNDCLIVASTDLSHYHPYPDANNIDKHCIDTLGRLRAKEFYDEAEMGTCELCGLMPVTTSLLTAQILGYNKIKTLKYANSGDITGDKSKVVGYLSAAIYKDEITAPAAASGGEALRNDAALKVKSNMLNDIQRKRLLGIARESITSFVKTGKRKAFNERDPVLNQPMGAFVTLHENGELRGCIGNAVVHGPLYQTIADMAIEAATGDFRFQRLSLGEINNISLEISVLSPLQKVNSADEIIIPGHGVIVKSGFNTGVYLPQVATETGWSKEEFLTSLCSQKAGLRPDAWKDPSTELYTFTAEVFGEGGKEHGE